MSTLQVRLGELITAIGADIKALKAAVPSDLSFSSNGAQTAHTGVSRLPIIGGNFTILGVAAMLNTAPTGATTFKVDVNKNGTTIFTTQANRPIWVASANAATVGTPDVTTLTTGDYLTVDIDAVGSTIAGSDLVVVVRIKAA